MPCCRTCNRIATSLIPCEDDSYLCERCAAIALELASEDGSERPSEPTPLLEPEPGGD